MITNGEDLGKAVGESVVGNQSNSKGLEERIRKQQAVPTLYFFRFFNNHGVFDKGKLLGTFISLFVGGFLLFLYLYVSSVMELNKKPNQKITFKEKLVETGDSLSVLSRYVLDFGINVRASTQNAIVEEFMENPKEMEWYPLPTDNTIKKANDYVPPVIIFVFIAFITFFIFSFFIVLLQKHYQKKLLHADIQFMYVPVQWIFKFWNRNKNGYVKVRTMPKLADKPFMKNDYKQIVASLFGLTISDNDLKKFEVVKEPKHLFSGVYEYWELYYVWDGVCSDPRKQHLYNKKNNKENTQQVQQNQNDIEDLKNDMEEMQDDLEGLEDMEI